MSSSENKIFKENTAQINFCSIFRFLICLEKLLRYIDICIHSKEVFTASTRMILMKFCMQLELNRCHLMALYEF